MLPLSPHLSLSYVALDHIIQQLQDVAGVEFDLWTIAQHQAHFFAKGGDYYKQVVKAYGGNVADNTHFQFREFPGKTFAFNKKEERLEVCSTHHRFLSSNSESLNKGHLIPYWEAICIVWGRIKGPFYSEGPF